MVLSALYGSTKYALNEITGQLVNLTGGRAFHTVIPGIASSPEILCTLLFDQETIDDSWSPLDMAEASQRIDRHERNLSGAAAH